MGILKETVLFSGSFPGSADMVRSRIQICCFKCKCPVVNRSELQNLGIYLLNFACGSERSYNILVVAGMIVISAGFETESDQNSKITKKKSFLYSVIAGLGISPIDF